MLNWFASLCTVPSNMPLCPILFSNTFAFYCAFTHIPFLNSSSQPSRFPIRTSYSIYIYYLLVPIESFIFVKRINDYLSVAIANFLVIEPFERSYDLMIWLENLGVCIRLYTLCIYMDLPTHSKVIWRSFWKLHWLLFSSVYSMEELKEYFIYTVSYKVIISIQIKYIFLLGIELECHYSSSLTPLRWNL